MNRLSKKILILKEISSKLKKTTEDFSPKKVYGVIRDYKKIFFDNKKDLKEYLKENNLSMKDSFKIEYLGSRLDHDNVISYTKNNNSFLYEMIDDSTYFRFDSNSGKGFRWQFKYGNITDYYKALDKYEVKKLVR